MDYCYVMFMPSLRLHQKSMKLFSLKASLTLISMTKIEESL